MAAEIDTVIPTAVGELNAVIREPDCDRPLPGVVLVDGSGDGAHDEWGGWPEWIGDAGAVVLRHDKPGCGGSPGHWTSQTLEDRAHESLAAIEVLRRRPSVAGQPIGLYGVSQGGWVALLAAWISDDVGFVVTHSGPGVSPAVQERGRLEVALRAAGVVDADFDEAMRWVDERDDRMRRGDDLAAIVAAQSEFAGRPWYSTVAVMYDHPRMVAFVARMLDFDPESVLPLVRCPTLALFGGADAQVDAAASAAVFARSLPRSADHGVVVFPGADHGLFTAARDPMVDRKSQLAPGYLEVVEAFLRARGVEA